MLRLEYSDTQITLPKSYRVLGITETCLQIHEETKLLPFKLSAMLGYPSDLWRFLEMLGTTSNKIKVARVLIDVTVEGMSNFTRQQRHLLQVLEIAEGLEMVTVVWDERNGPTINREEFGWKFVQAVKKNFQKTARGALIQFDLDTTSRRAWH